MTRPPVMTSKEPPLSLSRAEVPPPPRGEESLPRITRLNQPLYKIVFAILGAALLLLIAGWILLAVLGRPIPDSMPVVTATIVGALTGVIAADNKAGGR